jgi:glutamine amidotransferase
VKVAIVRYNAGNTASVMNALSRLGIAAWLTDDAAELAAADKVIFPGVGEASGAMRFLRERGLDVAICGLKQPVLGICLGMQLFCTSSEENETECLGIAGLRVKRFAASELKVPHMGWNQLEAGGSNLFRGIGSSEYFYFVHGYFAQVGNETAAVCTYGVPFSAAIEKDNFYGVQFHPEKSGDAGMEILKNFLNI